MVLVLSANVSIVLVNIITAGDVAMVVVDVSNVTDLMVNAALVVVVVAVKIGIKSNAINNGAVMDVVVNDLEAAMPVMVFIAEFVVDDALLVDVVVVVLALEKMWKM